MVKIEVHVKKKYFIRLIHKKSSLLGNILYFMNLCINIHIQNIFMVVVCMYVICTTISSLHGPVNCHYLSCRIDMGV